MTMPKKKPKSSGKQPPSTWDFDELNIEESRCRPGSKWTIKQEAADIVRELTALRDKKAWSDGFRRKDREVAFRWMGVWKLSTEIRTKIMEALSGGRLREAMGYIAEGCYQLGLDDGPKRNGARRINKQPINGTALALALTYAEEDGMLRKDALRLLRSGFPYLENRTFPKVSYNQAVKLLEDWANLQRKPRKHPPEGSHKASRHRVIPSEGY
jgi:hypothetical protein